MDWEQKAKQLELENPYSFSSLASPPHLPRHLNCFGSLSPVKYNANL